MKENFFLPKSIEIWQFYYVSEHSHFILENCAAFFSPGRCLGGDVEAAQIQTIGKSNHAIKNY